MGSQTDPVVLLGEMSWTTPPAWTVKPKTWTVTSPGYTEGDTYRGSIRVKKMVDR